MLINTIASDREIISPEKYLKFTQEEKSNIEDIRVIPPRLGSNNFGFLEIIYRLPVYKKVV